MIRISYCPRCELWRYLLFISVDQSKRIVISYHSNTSLIDNSAILLYITVTEFDVALSWNKVVGLNYHPPAVCNLSLIHPPCSLQF